ncbi:hypothetical protein Tco_1200427 [Tanacetum coccineum]
MLVLSSRFLSWFVSSLFVEISNARVGILGCYHRTGVLCSPFGVLVVFLCLKRSGMIGRSCKVTGRKEKGLVRMVTCCGKRLYCLVGRGVRYAREDDRGVTEGREDVREIFQQRGSGAKKKLSRCGRNQMGNEPILALPEGADDFVVYYDARSKDLEACLEKGEGGQYKTQVFYPFLRGGGGRRAGIDVVGFRLTNRLSEYEKDIASCRSFVKLFVKLFVGIFWKAKQSDQLEWVLWYAPWLSDQLEWICGMLHGLVINWSSSAIETSRNRVNVFSFITVFSLRLMMLGEVDRETLGLACGVLLIFTPRASALAGCDRLVSEPLVIEKGVFEVGEPSSAHDSSYVDGLAPWALRQRLKVLESREKATSKNKLVKAEMKLELARIEHDMVESRLHASYGWNKRFYMEMVRIGASQSFFHFAWVHINWYADLAANLAYPCPCPWFITSLTSCRNGDSHTKLLRRKES